MGKGKKVRITNKSENATYGEHSPIFKTAASTGSVSDSNLREALARLEELMALLPAYGDAVDLKVARDSASAAAAELKKRHLDRVTLGRCLDSLKRAVQNVATLAEVVRSVQSAIGHF
ncbi:MAG TPA: hypothetical protein VF493_16855 [Terriglobales bacterium]